MCGSKVTFTSSHGELWACASQLSMQIPERLSRVTLMFVQHHLQPVRQISDYLLSAWRRVMLEAARQYSGKL